MTDTAARLCFQMYLRQLRLSFTNRVALNASNMSPDGTAPFIVLQLSKQPFILSNFERFVDFQNNQVSLQAMFIQSIYILICDRVWEKVLYICNQTLSYWYLIKEHKKITECNLNQLINLFLTKDMTAWERGVAIMREGERVLFKDSSGLCYKYRKTVLLILSLKNLHF